MLLFIECPTCRELCIHYRQPTNIVMRSISPTSPSTKPGVAYPQYQQKEIQITLPVQRHLFG